MNGCVIVSEGRDCVNDSVDFHCDVYSSDFTCVMCCLLSVCDATGQTEYHATNGMFLSGNSIILLCIDLKKHSTNEERTTQLLYWLSAIHTAAEAQNQRLRVIICGTHCDGVSDKSMNRNDRTPFISENDRHKLKAFNSKFIEIEKDWYRLNAREVTCNQLAALRKHCSRMGMEMSGEIRLPIQIVRADAWLDERKSSFVLSESDFRAQLSTAVRSFEVDDNRSLWHPVSRPRFAAVKRLN